MKSPGRKAVQAACAGRVVFESRKPVEGKPGFHTTATAKKQHTKEEFRAILKRGKAKGIYGAPQRERT